MVYRRYGKRYRRRLGRSRRKVRMSKSLYKRRRYRRYRRRSRKSQGLTVSGNRESCLEESSFIPLAKLTKGSYVGALNDNFYMWSINPLPADLLMLLYAAVQLFYIPLCVPVFQLVYLDSI